MNNLIINTKNGYQENKSIINLNMINKFKFKNKGTMINYKNCVLGGNYSM